MEIQDVNIFVSTAFRGRRWSSGEVVMVLNGSGHRRTPQVGGWVEDKWKKSRRFYMVET